MLTDTLTQLSAGQDLTLEEMANVIDLVMQGACEEDQVGPLLLSLREKGETIDEIAGAATAMRRHMTPIQCDRPLLVDTCGTGGDSSGTFNISTAAAIVTAAAGVAVPKHGNRRITSKTGSADVLEELGIQVDAPVPVVEKCLAELGICFCFAPRLHPAMKHVMPIRRALGVPTIFNMLGPLCNPASAGCQLLGVGRRNLRPVLAEVLARLESGRSLVVCGADGLDELTINGPSHVSLVENGTVSEQEWQAADFGLSESRLDSLVVDDAAESAAMIRGLLSGQEGPARDIVVLNSAAAIWLARPELSKVESAEVAADAIDNGSATELLDAWSRLSREG